MSGREEIQPGQKQRISGSQPLSPGIYFYKKPISFSTAINYLSRPKLSDEPTGNRAWVMVIRTPTFQLEPDLDLLCDELSERIFWRMAQDIVRQVKEDAHTKQGKLKKVGSWDTQKSRAPSRGAKQRFVAGTTFQEWFTRVKTAVDQHELPWPYASKGRKPKYDRGVLVTLVLLTRLKGGSYEKIVVEAKDARLNCLREADGAFVGEVAVPCPSYVHKIATEKIPLDFYEQILRHFDQEACEIYEERLQLTTPQLFAVDGTDFLGAEKELRQTNQYTTYAFQRVPFQVTSRLTTNTVFNLTLLEASGQAPLQEGLNHLSEGAVVLGDKLYDIEANHQATEVAGIEFHAPGKKQRGKPYQGEARARTRKRFDAILYKQRKKVERPFGNLVSRGLKRIFSRSSHTRCVELALWLIAHNLLALRGQEYYQQSYRLVPHFRLLVRPISSKQAAGHPPAPPPVLEEPFKPPPPPHPFSCS